MAKAKGARNMAWMDAIILSLTITRLSVDVKTEAIALAPKIINLT